MTRTNEEMVIGLKELIISLFNMDDITDEAFEEAIDMHEDMKDKDDVYEKLTGRSQGRCGQDVGYMVDHGFVGAYPVFYEKDEAWECLTNMGIEDPRIDGTVRRVTIEE